MDETLESDQRHSMPAAGPQQCTCLSRSCQAQRAGQLPGQRIALCLGLGLSLILPGCGTSEDRTPAETSAADQQSRADASGSPDELPAGQPQPPSLAHIPAVPADEIHLTIEPESPARYHRVSRGESLSGIASQNRTSVEALQRLNGLDDPGFLEPGQLLRLP